MTGSFCVHRVGLWPLVVACCFAACATDTPGQATPTGPSASPPTTPRAPAPSAPVSTDIRTTPQLHGVLPLPTDPIRVSFPRAIAARSLAQATVHLSTGPNRHGVYATTPATLHLVSASELEIRPKTPLAREGVKLLLTGLTYDGAGAVPDIELSFSVRRWVERVKVFIDTDPHTERELPNTSSIRQVVMHGARTRQDLSGSSSNDSISGWIEVVAKGPGLQEMRGFRAAGFDGQWMTSDDRLDSLTNLRTDAMNRSVGYVKIDPGFDGFLRTNDDVEIEKAMTEYSPDGVKTSIRNIGSDYTPDTNDDVNTCQLVQYNEQGLATHELERVAGRYSCQVLTPQAQNGERRLTERTFDGDSRLITEVVTITQPTIGPAYQTRDEVAYNDQGLVAHRLKRFAGMDQTFDTGDDVWLERTDYTYDAEQAQSGETYSAGNDGELYTADDILLGRSFELL